MSREHPRTKDKSRVTLTRTVEIRVSVSAFSDGHVEFDVDTHEHTASLNGNLTFIASDGADFSDLTATDAWMRERLAAAVASLTPKESK